MICVCIAFGNVSCEYSLNMDLNVKKAKTNTYKMVHTNKTSNHSMYEYSKGGTKNHTVERYVTNRKKKHNPQQKVLIDGFVHKESVCLQCKIEFVTMQFKCNSRDYKRGRE